MARTAAQPTERIYILDDDAELCSSLAWLLESVNLRAECFGDAAEFLEAFDDELTSCLVLDVRMPQMSGLEVQDVLNRFGATVPVVFVSAHGDIRMSVRAMQHGAVDFLEKPYDPQHMLDVVQGALRTARQRQAERAERSATVAKMASLTPREREILGLLVAGESSKAMAARLGISVKTVDVHRARIREKTGADTLSALVGEVLRSGIDPEVIR